MELLKKIAFFGLLLQKKQFSEILSGTLKTAVGVVVLQKGTDIIIGSRSGTRKGAPLTRKVMAVGFIFIRNFIIGLKNIKDTQCGFKAFKTDAAKKIIHSLVVFKNTQGVEGSSVSAGFDLEFLFLATKMGMSIQEIPVIWKHVETKNVNFITDTIETLQDILRIKYYDITGKY